MLPSMRPVVQPIVRSSVRPFKFKESHARDLLLDLPEKFDVNNIEWVGIWSDKVFSEFGSFSVANVTDSIPPHVAPPYSSVSAWLVRLSRRSVSVSCSISWSRAPKPAGSPGPRPPCSSTGSAASWRSSWARPVAKAASSAGGTRTRPTGTCFTSTTCWRPNYSSKRTSTTRSSERRSASPSPVEDCSLFRISRIETGSDVKGEFHPVYITDDPLGGRRKVFHQKEEVNWVTKAGHK